MFNVNERAKFEVIIEDRIEKMNKTILYVLKTNKGDILLYETKDSYKEILERKFSETNKITALIEFVNSFNGKVVISNVRFLKKDTEIA